MSARTMLNALGVAALGYLIASGTGCEQIPLEPGAGGNAAPSSSHAVSSSTGGAPPGADLCPPQQKPPSAVPDGWVKWDDWSCQCYFYVPGSERALPEPVVWKPCPALGDALVCRVMEAPWMGYMSSGSATPPPTFFRRPDGTPALAFRRNDMQAPMSLVADVDGPVHSAMIALWNSMTQPGCILSNIFAADDRWVVTPRGEFYAGYYKNSDKRGVIGGRVGEPLPEVLFEERSSLVETYVANGTWIARTDTANQVFVYSWNAPSVPIFVASQATDPEQLQLGPVLLNDDAVFYESSNAYRRGFNVWTQAGGAKPFIRWVGDATRGAGNLGTDGIDLVWSEGEGKLASTPAPDYPTISIMTAKYTTDPSQLEPRRLRSHPFDWFNVAPWAVGCGYAASDSFNNTSAWVVRLSDGWAWEIPQHDERFVYRSIGLTCQEVFAYARVGGIENIVRIRLDSLGPGVPPD